MKNIGRHWPARDGSNCGTPSGAFRHQFSPNCQEQWGHHDAQEFIGKLDAQGFSQQQNLHVERCIAELAGGLKALKQEQKAQQRCLKSLQENVDSCRQASLQWHKQVEEQKLLLQEIRADSQDFAARMEEHQVHLGVTRSRVETQDRLLASLGNRLELQGEQIMSQVQRQCSQATQKLQSELITWAEIASSEIGQSPQKGVGSTEKEKGSPKASPRNSEDALAAVVQSIAVAQRGISEVKQSLLMVVEGHAGGQNEVQELRPSISRLADRMGEQESAISSVKKQMDEVSASLKERIEMAETSSQRVTNLFQELRKDMAKLLDSEEPDGRKLEASLEAAAEETKSLSVEVAQNASSSEYKGCSENTTEHASDIQTVQSATGAATRRFQSLSLVDSDGEYDDDEFEDDLPIEIQGSRRSSLSQE